MRQEMPENARIFGLSQVYLLVREKENTGFQHDSREDGHEDDARSIP